MYPYFFGEKQLHYLPKKIFWKKSDFRRENALYIYMSNLTLEINKQRKKVNFYEEINDGSTIFLDKSTKNMKLEKDIKTIFLDSQKGIQAKYNEMERAVKIC